MTQPSPHNWEAEPFEADTDSLSGTLDDPLLRREWFLIAWSSELAAGKAVSRRVLGRDLVISRSPNGSCCDSSSPEPSEADSFQCCEAYGGIWVSLSDEPAELPDYALAETPGFRVVAAGPYRFRARGQDVIAQALGMLHLGFLQAALFGDLGPPFEVERFDVAESAVGPPSGRIAISRLGFASSPASRFACRVWLAGLFTTGIESADAESANIHLGLGILIQATPIDAELCEMRLLTAMNNHYEITAEELRRRQEQIIEKLRTMLESHHPEDEEMRGTHPMAAAYRNWLGRIGIRRG